VRARQAEPVAMPAYAALGAVVDETEFLAEADLARY
jgi:hypothetical protein